MLAARTGERRRRMRRAAALEADRDHPDPVLGVDRKHRQQLIRVALWIPAVRVRIRPVADGCRILVVEDRLGHAGIEQLAFGGLAWRGHPAVDQEARALDRDRGLRWRNERPPDARLLPECDERGKQ